MDIPVKEKEKQAGFYHLYSPGEIEPVLVHYYYSNDAGCWGFGYNIHDGTGFMPECDLRKDCKIIPVEIKEIEHK